MAVDFRANVMWAEGLYSALPDKRSSPFQIKLYLATDVNTIYRSVYGADWSPLPVGGGGNSVLHGAGVPSSGTGSNGDFYIDTATYLIYGPKALGAWGAGVSLIGAAGTPGMIWDDVWAPTFPGGYPINHVVSYGGSSWISLHNANSATPVAGLDWTPVAIGGVDASSKLDGPHAVASNVNVTVEVTPTFKDIAGAFTVPGVTSLCRIEFRGMIGLVGSLAAGAGNPHGYWRVIDDTGAEVAQQQHWGIFTGASQADTEPLDISIEVTPTSALQTFQLQAALGAAYVGLTVRAYGPAVAGKNCVRGSSYTL